MLINLREYITSTPLHPSPPSHDPVRLCPAAPPPADVCPPPAGSAAPAAPQAATPGRPRSQKHRAETRSLRFRVSGGGGGRGRAAKLLSGAELVPFLAGWLVVFGVGALVGTSQRPLPKGQGPGPKLRLRASGQTCAQAFRFS